MHVRTAKEGAERQSSVAQMLPVYFILRVYSEYRVHFVLRVLRVLEYWRPKYLEYWDYEQY